MNYQYVATSVRHIFEMMTSKRFFSDIVNWHIVLADYFGINRHRMMDIQFKDGTTLTVRGQSNDKWPMHEIYVRDDYRLHELKPHLKFIIDLGGYNGDFAIQAARLNPQAKIVSLEPSQENFRLLVNNVEQNGYRKRILPLRYAAAKKRGFLTFYLSMNNGGHSLVPRNSDYQVKVRTLTLLDIMKRSKFTRCDLLKLDIEGGEYEILYNLSSSLYKKIKSISMEYHNLDQKSQNGVSLARFLKKQGYSVSFHDSFNKTLGQLYATKDN